MSNNRWAYEKAARVLVGSWQWINFPTFVFRVNKEQEVSVLQVKCALGLKKNSNKQPMHKERLLRRLSLIQNFLCSLALVIHR